MPGRTNLEKTVTYINKFMSGQYSQRSPLFTPVSTMGIQVVQRQDSFLGGADVDISHKMTLIRRPGFGVYTTAQLTAGDYPQAFFSFKNTAGTVRAMIETPSAVSTFTTSAVTKVITKNTTAQGSMNKIANLMYYCDGNDSDTLKWDGTTLSKWGIVAPVIGPSLSFGAGGGLTTVNGGYQYCYVFQNANTPHISSTSPVSPSTLNFTNETVTISGDGSTDSQVTNIQIYRTEDGGADYYLLATIANTPNWSYADTTPDSGLNTDLVVFPGSMSNNPPPSGSNLCVWYQDRFFIAAGAFLYFSAGPDITNGNPQACFPPANYFQLPGNITAFASTQAGLLIFTSADCFALQGNSTLTYGVVPFQLNLGVAAQNCCNVYGNLVNIFTTQGIFNQFATDGSVPFSEIGFPIESALATFNPLTSSITTHRSGADEGLFISNGSTQMYRYSMTLNSWSTAYNPVGGCGVVASIEATAANYQMLMGRASGSNIILTRTPTANNDDGQVYPCNVTLGSLVFASPHQWSSIEAVMVQAMPAGTYPTVGVLLNEIAGSFTTVPPSSADPWQLPASSSVIAKQHALTGANTPLPINEVQHMQILLSFPAEDAQNEILGIAVI